MAGAALLHMPGVAQAQQPPSIDSIVQPQLLPGWRTDTGTHMAAVHIRLADGWKTYWRNPGEAGIAPQFDWTGSRNVASVRLHWPRPMVFYSSGMRSIGFADQLVLPVEVNLRDPQAPARLSLRMDLGVCDDICIPLSLDLATDLAARGAQDPAIVAALHSAPAPAASAGLRSASCRVEPIDDGLRVTARLEMPSLGGAEFVVFELPGSDVWISAAHSERNGGSLTARADFVDRSGAPFALSRQDLRITVLGTSRAADIRGC